jgi:4-hydroxythreonine-4-phosphate dehydrogenase
MASALPLIAISSGEPAGIGPDICLALANEPRRERFVVLGDTELLESRARQLSLRVSIRSLRKPEEALVHTPGELQVIEHRVQTPVTPGELNPDNAGYVVKLISEGARGCLHGTYAALVTAPVQKSVIADSGTQFMGHTEFLAELCGVAQPVMLLTRDTLRVALVTTHLPLRDVPQAITAERITRVVHVLDADLRRLFGIAAPRILVLGLNPHAGENGHLGSEEREIIEPCLAVLRNRGIDVTGPRPADTAFTERSLAGFDAVLAMYHDQGLTPIKAGGFGRIVNVTLGLPIIRTSVDHGTALALAGSGDADPASLGCALELAATIAARQATS